MFESVCMVGSNGSNEAVVERSYGTNHGCGFAWHWGERGRGVTRVCYVIYRLRLSRNQRGGG